MNEDQIGDRRKGGEVYRKRTKTPTEREEVRKGKTPPVKLLKGDLGSLFAIG